MSARTGIHTWYYYYLYIDYRILSKNKQKWLFPKHTIISNACQISGVLIAIGH